MHTRYSSVLSTHVTRCKVVFVMKSYDTSLGRSVKRVPIKVRMLILCDMWIRRNVLIAMPEYGTIILQT